MSIEECSYKYWSVELSPNLQFASALETTGLELVDRGLLFLLSFGGGVDDMASILFIAFSNIPRNSSIFHVLCTIRSQSLPINTGRVDPRVRRDELRTWRVEEEWCVMSRSRESTRRTRWPQVWSRRDDLGSWRDELVGDERNRPNSRRDDLGSRWDELGTQRDKPE